MFPALLAASLATVPDLSCLEPPRLDPLEWLEWLPFTFVCHGHYVDPRNTAERLEERVIIFQLRKKRLPTPADLDAMFPDGLPTDGYGHPLRYVLVDEDPGFDIVSLGRDGAWGARCGRHDERDRSLHGFAAPPWD